MAWHIRSLLDYVQELVPIVETFQTLCESELKRRRKRQQSVAKCGTSYVDEQENQAAVTQFQEEMNKVKTKFRVLANQHQVSRRNPILAGSVLKNKSESMIFDKV